MLQAAETQMDRLQFINFGEGDAFALRRFRPQLEENLQAILSKFYEHIGGYPELLAKFNGRAGLDHARKAQALHWLGMFEGNLDQQYVERVKRIGKTHERIGLEPRWYIGGYALALGDIIALAVAQPDIATEELQELIRAIVKVVLLDMDYAISVYIEEGKANFNRQMNSLADGFESSVLKVVNSIGASASNMKDSASTMAAAAEETQSQTSTVAAAAEQMSVNVQTVAAAAEELSSSIKEINRQVLHSTEIAKVAVGQADDTNASVKQLSEAGQRIGQVVKLINTIAGQTHLLALNATIEASRAGEAGKGFAVVASEVKSLANQTAKATDDIAEHVASIQSATNMSVDGLGKITKTINEISGISDSIASAVQQQGAATQEIARNVQQAAVGTNEVSANVTGVSQAATDTGHNASSVLQGAQSLAEQADALRNSVQEFLAKIRQGQ
jgi:methyl-accepting chemotaxis protein